MRHQATEHAGWDVSCHYDRSLAAPRTQARTARYRGSDVSITGILPGGEQIPLFRPRYGGPPRRTRPRILTPRTYGAIQ